MPRTIHARQQARARVRAPGTTQAGSNVVQRIEHPVAFAKPGCGSVRIGRRRVLAPYSSRSKSMRAAPSDDRLLAPERVSSCCSSCEQLGRRAARQQARNGIDEIRLILRPERARPIQRERSTSSESGTPASASNARSTCAAGLRDCCRARRKRASSSGVVAPPRTRQVAAGRRRRRRDGASRGGCGIARLAGPASTWPTRCSSGNVWICVHHSPTSGSTSPAATRSSRKS